MKTIRSTGLILITAGLLSTSGPTWATGNSAQPSPGRPGISAGFLDALGGLWDSVLSGFQAILGDDDAQTKEEDGTGTVPGGTQPQGTTTGGPIYPGGGCIDPNGVYIC